MKIIATFPLPDGSEIAVSRDGDSWNVEDFETPPRFRPFTRATEREALALADRVANVYRYPNARTVED